MGIEQQIISVVEQAVKNALAGLEVPQKGTLTDDCLLTTKQAGNLLGCSDEYVRAMQDKGELSLCFLPGSKKHRRVLKSEVLIAVKNSITKPASKKKNNHSP